MNPVLKAYHDQLTWQAVKSSNVAAVAYQKDFSYLWVRFKNGSVYLYEHVPEGVYSGLLAAPSKGSYVWSVIRAKGTDSYYPFRKVS